jgi:hypothetical protein
VKVIIIIIIIIIIIKYFADTLLAATKYNPMLIMIIRSLKTLRLLVITKQFFLPTCDTFDEDRKAFLKLTGWAEHR